MWTLGALFVLPRSQLAARVKQVGEPIYPQELFSQPAMEAFHMRVLRWLAGLNMSYRCAPGCSKQGNAD